MQNVGGGPWSFTAGDIVRRQRGRLWRVERADCYQGFAAYGLIRVDLVGGKVVVARGQRVSINDVLEVSVQPSLFVAETKGRFLASTSPYALERWRDDDDAMQPCHFSLVKAARPRFLLGEHVLGKDRLSGMTGVARIAAISVVGRKAVGDASRYEVRCHPVGGGSPMLCVYDGRAAVKRRGVRPLLSTQLARRAAGKAK